MRILEMITPSRIGGAETYFATTVQQLQAQGDMVTAFCPTGRPIVAYLHARDITPVTWQTWGKVDPKSLVKLVALIKDRQIDVVHTHLSSATLIGAHAAKLVGIPCVATVHGFVDAFCYRFAHRLIAVSVAIQTHLLAQGIPAERIVVVRNGLQLDQYQPLPVAEAKVACGFEVTVPRVGFFGRLSPEKGPDVALRAWPLVLAQYPSARLMLVGEGKRRAELEQLAADLRIADQVDFVGFVSDPRARMRACDLVVVPSRKEGLGLAALEAMALRRPVVATDTGGLREIILDGTNGFSFPPEDHQTLAQALLRMLSDSALASRLGEAAHRHVHEHFDIQRQIALLREVFREAIPASPEAA